MRMRLINLVALLCLAIPVFAQDAVSTVDDRWLLRLQKSEFDTFNPRMIETCMVVYGDGRVHIEKASQEISSGSKPDARVYEGKLSEQEMESTRKVIEADDFKKINARPSDRNIVSHADESLTASIRHDDGMQNFIFPDLASRKDFNKPLKPFLDWIRMVDKKKFPQNKQGKVTRCMPQQQEED